MGTPRDSGRPATGSVRGVKCPAHVAQAGTDLMLVRPCSWSRTVMPTCRLTFKGRTLAIGGVGPRDGGCLRCSAARTAPGRPRSRCPWSVALTRRQVMHSVGQGPVHVPCRRKRPRSRWFTLGVRRLRCVGRFADCIARFAWVGVDIWSRMVSDIRTQARAGICSVQPPCQRPAQSEPCD